MMIDSRWKSQYIDTNATTLLKTGPGRLQSITIGDPGAGSLVILYDNIVASGRIIAELNTSLSQGTISFDDLFDIGLTVVTSGLKAALLTVRYK